jgi:hypothetical protein
MSCKELATVKKYINKMLGKGIISPSTTEILSPILLVKKPSRGLRFCVNYRGLNKIIIKN